MSEELKPCPFCGANGAIKTDFYDYQRYWIECMGCEMTIFEKPVCDSEEGAVAAWNRRFVCKDKNGKKVFVGDKVKCTEGADDEIEIQEGCPYLRRRCCTLYEYLYGVGGEIEIIGGVAK